ncbi:hypothetical protein OOT46_07405 [Aquabacterium sp. A7-Y]|uniref:hypothetical protein n=1 Tax=Aquabacterium sp. A7-Y TaxID=1349605 RepID=UPI00223C992C|nr:hypothetical protein [Aquabacterium sp. A7-Y]MCW7537676.1 hypothetical protein [Aquabacterium sp. A7-Y]
MEIELGTLDASAGWEKAGQPQGKSPWFSPSYIVIYVSSTTLCTPGNTAQLAAFGRLCGGADSGYAPQN